MTLSEARLSHLAQLVLKVMTAEGVGRVLRSEHLLLTEAKKVLLEELDSDGRLDQLARGRIPPRVQPGSREWDVLYRRYLDEERRKLGR